MNHRFFSDYDRWLTTQPDDGRDELVEATRKHFKLASDDEVTMEMIDHYCQFPDQEPDWDAIREERMERELDRCDSYQIDYED